MAAQEFHCSFCDKAESEVAKIIAGKNNSFICNECVDVCNDILADTPRATFRNVDTDTMSSPPHLFHFKCPECGHRWARLIEVPRS